MSRIKEQYLTFYNSSRENYDDALITCRATSDNGDCDMKCQTCPLQKIKKLYDSIHYTCEYALTKE